MDPYSNHQELEARILEMCNGKKQRKYAKLGMLTAYTILNEYSDQNRELESTEEFAKCALAGAQEDSVSVCAYMLHDIAPALHLYFTQNRVFG